MQPAENDWRSFVREANRAQVRFAVAESWERSRQSGVDVKAPKYRRVDKSCLAERLDLNKDLIEIAQSHMEWLSFTYSGFEYVVILVDRDGIVLYSAGNPAHVVADAKVQPGYDWSEQVMGTNAVGTALVENHPVAIFGDQHFVKSNRSYTCMGAPVHAPDGTVIGAIGISTGRSEGHPERLVALAHIAHVVDQELHNRAKLRSAESLRLLARLSSFLAHELAAPLTALSGFLALLCKQPQTERGDELLTQCREISGQMRDLIRDIRSLGMEMEGEFRQVTVQSLLRETLSRLDLPSTYNVELKLQGNPKVNCQARLLTLAVLNLMRNAVEAMPDGGDVGILVRERGEDICITIWDTGLGVPKELRTKLLNHSFTTKTHGSGLGLLLTRAIVENVHKGALSYAPNKPRGSRFRIKLQKDPFDEGAKA